MRRSVRFVSVPGRLFASRHGRLGRSGLSRRLRWLRNWLRLLRHGRCNSQLIRKLRPVGAAGRRRLFFRLRGWPRRWGWCGRFRGFGGFVFRLHLGPDLRCQRIPVVRITHL